MIFRLNMDDDRFPDPALAEEDGLLAVGGDLRPSRLVEAYRNGIFPWHQQQGVFFWYAPHDRFVLFPDELKISKSMRKVMRSGQFSVTHNQAFGQVIQACAEYPRRGQDGTWIDNDMQAAYIELHETGHAHSFEAWQDGQLAGGLYGVAVGDVFCGESMFSLVPNASKAALITLSQMDTYHLIDCQIYSDHLASMGARMISQDEYLSYLP